MKISIRLLVLIIFFGGVIGSISAGPRAILNAGQKEAAPYERKYDYQGHWAEIYIREAIIKGIVNGYPDGSFKPDEPITRAGFAAMLDKAVQDPAVGEGETDLDFTGFKDYPDIPEWAKSGFSKALRLGWLKPYPDNTVRPLNLLDRADIISLLPIEKLSSRVFQDKNNTVVTRAEACIINLNIEKFSLER